MKSFKLIAFTVFVQFRKNQQGEFLPPRPKIGLRLRSQTKKQQRKNNFFKSLVNIILQF